MFFLGAVWVQDSNSFSLTPVISGQQPIYNLPSNYTYNVRFYRVEHCVTVFCLINMPMQSVKFMSKHLFSIVRLIYFVAYVR